MHNRVGGVVTGPTYSHHRTCGSAPGGSLRRERCTATMYAAAIGASNSVTVKLFFPETAENRSD